MRQILLTTWVAMTAAGCNFESSGGSAGATDSDATMESEGADGAATGSVMPPATGGEATDSAATTEMGVSYCHGFQAVAAEPFLALYVLGGEALEDGVFWPLECGDEGKWMFGLYPSLGGWNPMADDVTFTIEVDVEGFAADATGHFFHDEVDYHIGCEDPFAALLGVAPVYPPASVTDPSKLDGQPAKVRVTVLAGAMQLMVEATVTLSAPSDLVLQGCTSP